MDPWEQNLRSLKAAETPSQRVIFDNNANVIPHSGFSSHKRDFENNFGLNYYQTSAATSQQNYQMDPLDAWEEKVFAPKIDSQRKARITDIVSNAIEQIIDLGVEQSQVLSGNQMNYSNPVHTTFSGGSTHFNAAPSASFNFMQPDVKPGQREEQARFRALLQNQRTVQDVVSKCREFGWRPDTGSYVSAYKDVSGRSDNRHFSTAPSSFASHNNSTKESINWNQTQNRVAASSTAPASSDAFGKKPEPKYILNFTQIVNCPAPPASSTKSGYEDILSKGLPIDPRTIVSGNTESKISYSTYVDSAHAPVNNLAQSYGPDLSNYTPRNGPMPYSSTTNVANMNAGIDPNYGFYPTSNPATSQIAADISHLNTAVRNDSDLNSHFPSLNVPASQSEFINYGPTSNPIPNHPSRNPTYANNATMPGPIHNTQYSNQPESANYYVPKPVSVSHDPMRHADRQFNNQPEGRNPDPSFNPAANRNTSYSNVSYTPNQSNSVNYGPVLQRPTLPPSYHPIAGDNRNAVNNPTLQRCNPIGGAINNPTLQRCNPIGGVINNPTLQRCNPVGGVINNPTLRRNTVGGAINNPNLLASNPIDSQANQQAAFVNGGSHFYDPTLNSMDHNSSQQTLVSNRKSLNDALLKRYLLSKAPRPAPISRGRKSANNATRRKSGAVPMNDAPHAVSTNIENQPDRRNSDSGIPGNAADRFNSMHFGNSVNDSRSYDQISNHAANSTARSTRGKARCSRGKARSKLTRNNFDPTLNPTANCGPPQISQFNDIGQNGARHLEPATGSAEYHSDSQVNAVGQNGSRHLEPSTGSPEYHSNPQVNATGQNGSRHLEPSTGSPEYHSNPLPSRVNSSKKPHNQTSMQTTPLTVEHPVVMPSENQSEIANISRISNPFFKDNVPSATKAYVTAGNDAEEFVLVIDLEGENDIVPDVNTESAPEHASRDGSDEALPDSDVLRPTARDDYDQSCQSLENQLNQTEMISFTPRKKKPANETEKESGSEKRTKRKSQEEESDGKKRKETKEDIARKEAYRISLIEEMNLFEDVS